jgi:hypothetical protein
MIALLLLLLLQLLPLLLLLLLLLATERGKVPYSGGNLANPWIWHGGGGGSGNGGVLSPSIVRRDSHCSCSASNVVLFGGSEFLLFGSRSLSFTIDVVTSCRRSCCRPFSSCSSAARSDRLSAENAWCVVVVPSRSSTNLTVLVVDRPMSAAADADVSVPGADEHVAAGSLNLTLLFTVVPVFDVPVDDDDVRCDDEFVRPSSPSCFHSFPPFSIPVFGAGGW